MKLRCEEWNEKTKISDPRVKNTGSSSEITWKFIAGSCFLLFVFERKVGFSFDEIIKEIKSEKISTDELSRHSVIPIYESKKGVKIFCCDEGAFINNGRKFVLNGKNIVRQSQGVAVFVCEIDKDDFIIYKKPKDERDENIGYVPIKVVPYIRYKRHFLKKYRTCIIKLERILNYDEGAICYKVEGVRGTFPLTSACLGKEIHIDVDKNQEVQIVIAPEFSKYYIKS